MHVLGSADRPRLTRSLRSHSICSSDYASAEIFRDVISSGRLGLWDCLTRSRCSFLLGFGWPCARFEKALNERYLHQHRQARPTRLCSSHHPRIISPASSPTPLAPTQQVDVAQLDISELLVIYLFIGYDVSREQAQLEDGREARSRRPVGRPSKACVCSSIM